MEVKQLSTGEILIDLRARWRFGGAGEFDISTADLLESLRLRSGMLYQQVMTEEYPKRKAGR